MRALLNTVAAMIGLAAAAASLHGDPPTRERAEDAAVVAAMEKAAREKNVPVSFYGKVIDQHGNPVEGAEAVVGVTRVDPKGVMFQSVKSIVARTDKAGGFSVQDERGWTLAVSEVSKDGYEYPPTERSRYGRFDYAQNYVNRHIPDKNKPVLFHLRKKGPTTFLLECSDFLPRVAVRPDGRAVVVEISRNPEHCGPDNRERLPGFAVSAILAKDSRDWVLTLRGKHDEDEVLLLDHAVYEAPEQGYRPSEELRMAMGKNPVPGRGPTYPHETNAWLIVRWAKPRAYARVALGLYPRHEERCDINYHITVNPYGESGFDHATEVDKHFDIWRSLQKQAMDALCNGQLPPKPDIPRLIQEAKPSRTPARASHE